MSVYGTVYGSSSPTAAEIAEATRLSLERAGGPLLETASDALSAKTNAQTAAAKATALDNRLPAEPARAAGEFTAADRIKLVTVHGRLPSSNQLIAGVNDAQGKPPGAGADPATLHFETPDGFPIADADVWVTTDAAGLNTIAGTLQTNSQGDVRFQLDKFAVDGTTLITYYASGQKDGENFLANDPFTCD